LLLLLLLLLLLSVVLALRAGQQVCCQLGYLPLMGSEQINLLCLWPPLGCGHQRCPPMIASEKQVRVFARKLSFHAQGHWLTLN